MRSTETLSDEALQRLLESREQFLRFIRTRVHGSMDVEDLLHGALVKAIKRGGQLRDGESAVAWFYRILRNSIADHYRANAHPAPELPPVQEHREVCECLHALVENLKPEYRDAIRLVDLQQKPLAELAAFAHISAGNAAVRVHRARQALKKQVQNVCGVCAEHYCLDCRCTHQKSPHFE
jgi:RNA polymerase sigma-70 factor (ECF subfamily)